MAAVLRFINISILFSLACAVPRAWADETQVCIDRPGENGSINILPVTIVIHENAELTILGEQEVCFRSHMSDWPRATISLKFPAPYGGLYDKRKWQTKETSVSLAAGKTTRLLLCERQQNHNDPRWEKTGWHDMWLLLPQGEEKLCAQ